MIAWSHMPVSKGRGAFSQVNLTNGTKFKIEPSTELKLKPLHLQMPLPQRPRYVIETAASDVSEVS